MRLFLDKGYDATTVEEIAAAAGVSHMTVFRHFATKGAIVLSDDYDPIISDAIRSRPSTEPALESIHQAIIDVFSRFSEQEIELVRKRTMLILATPALHAGLWANTLDTSRMLSEALKDRGGAPGDEELEVVTAMASALFASATLRWVRSGGQDSIPDLLDRTFAIGRATFTSTDHENTPSG